MSEAVAAVGGFAKDVFSNVSNAFSSVGSESGGFFSNSLVQKGIGAAVGGLASAAFAPKAQSSGSGFGAAQQLPQIQAPTKTTAGASLADQKKKDSRIAGLLGKRKTKTIFTSGQGVTEDANVSVKKLLGS